jgi:hypothetical protein
MAGQTLVSFLVKNYRSDIEALKVFLERLASTLSSLLLSREQLPKPLHPKALAVAHRATSTIPAN